jgi:S-methylmethionine-dependent homocysteine/selenocysteine methylase
MQPYEVVRERLSRGQTVILDGGVGSELVRRGVRWRDHLRLPTLSPRGGQLAAWACPTGWPIVPNETGALFSGETLAEACAALEGLAPDAVLVNCAPPPDIAAGLAELVRHATTPIGAYPHIGRFDPPEWLFTDEYPPQDYLAVAREWVATGARVVGGCCGTTPEHIALLARELTRQ